QAGADLDVVLCEKRHELFIARLQKDREIAPIDDTQPAESQRADEATKPGVHLRRAAREVDRLQAGQFTMVLINPADDAPDRRRGHHLGALRPGLDVAVMAREVTEFAEVYLQRRQRVTPQREPIRGKPL